MTAMVRADGLTRRYGERTVLDRLDFGIERGERLALLGSNGAGKTTLFRCLLGLIGFEGRLTVDGLECGPAGQDVRARIAYVPQVPPVFDLTLTRFVDLFAGLRRIPVGDVDERLEDLGLSLAEAGERPLRALSGGTIQKAYLALALAARTPVLLLDEPTASLDPVSRRDLLRHLTEVGRDTTMILASHRLEEIEPLADRVMVLASGRIAFDGSLDALWSTTGFEAGLWVETVRGFRPSPVPGNGAGILAGTLTVRSS
jgi:ABC-2 type transport system ATP-binding protein